MAKVPQLTFNAISGKRVILRLDLNVPLRQGRIRDDRKIKAVLPFIRQLRRNSPLIILTHLGEPQPKRAYQSFPELSVAPIVRRLQQVLGGHVQLATGSWPELRAQAAGLKAGDIMVLENIRFWKGETKNDASFARQLASLGKIYINDAFDVSHRAHASVSAIKKFLPSYPGPSLTEEAKQLTRVSKGRKPFVLIVGGAKISSKLPLIEKFLPRAEAILVGGGLANSLLRARGIKIGASFKTELTPRLARRLQAATIILPIDAVVSSGRRHSIKKITAIGAQDKIIDIGPATAALFLKHIVRARTIFWNGPVGIFEDKSARNGTKALLKGMARATAGGGCAVVGGGETADVTAELGYSKKLSWVSTGGGASLAYLAGEAMPGLKGLVQ